ncbi:acyl-CoA carboxylase subunit epsilon [Nocardioides pantholopis]|uniref:acyl-CoA carboxylase subunit epsilon n=1 Tax=Nocardioides pantholopis TaxID=2483798 RepID=UPI000F077B52|nr:acyl-CoA carboxylase subunit epsilon [Nocardioides pantholopis]
MSAEEQGPTTPEAARPLLRVVSPHATPEEVAAIVAVLSSLGGGAPAPRGPRATWGHPARGVRQVSTPQLPAHGLGGWRTSGLPR